MKCILNHEKEADCLGRKGVTAVVIPVVQLPPWAYKHNLSKENWTPSVQHQSQKEQK